MFAVAGYHAVVCDAFILKWQEGQIFPYKMISLSNICIRLYNSQYDCLDKVLDLAMPLTPERESHIIAVLQIRRGIRDNLGIISHISP